MARWSVFVTASSLLAACTNDYSPLDAAAASGPGSAGATGSQAASSGAGAGGGAASSGVAGSGSGSGGAGAAGGSSGGTGGSGGVGLCPAYFALSDDFEDGAVGPQWVAFSSAPTTVVETGGELVVTIGASNDGFDHYAGYGSVMSYDFTGCEVVVSVSTVPNPAAYANSYFGIMLDAGTGFYFSALEGELRCRTSTDGSPSTLGAVSFDPVAHRRWRVREQGGTAYCETSDGVSAWVELGSTSTPPHLSAGKVELGAGNYYQVESAGDARFRDLNSL